MSNISRRDFLKTAGVMTLAVAAAGVLAGCEGNTVPEAPETGAKALGDVVTIGTFEFSVVAAIRQDMVTRSVDNDGKVTNKVTESYVDYLMSVRNTEGEKAFDFSKVSLYINGKRVEVTGRDLTADYMKKFYGIEGTSKNISNNTLKADKKATYFDVYTKLVDVDAYGDLKPVNSVEITYFNRADKTSVNYVVPMPLKVVEIGSVAK